MYKIFIIGSINELKNRLDNNQYNLLNYIKNNSNFEIKFMEYTNFTNYKEKLNFPDNTILYFICFNPDLNDLNNKENLVIIYDQWDLYCTCGYKCLGNKKCGFIKHFNNNRLKSYNYIISRFDTYLTQKYFKNFYKFGYYMDNNIFKDWKLEKKYDIFFYGNILNKSYPFRNRLHYLLQKDKDLNIKIIPYSARLRKQKKLLSGMELSKLINQSWITISTKATIDALLQKYYEIGFSKSVICGDYPDLEKDNVIKENMILIDHLMTDEEILKKIKNYLNNKDKLIQMSNKCYEHMINNYTYQNGLKDFEKIIKNITNK